MHDQISDIPEAAAEDPVRPSFEGIIEKLDEKYAGWERSRAALYHILGYMFEAAAVIDSDVRLQAQLTAEVRKMPDVKASSRWKPDRKDTFEQLLALRFGITGKEMGLKSNWLKTLRAAEAVSPPLPRTEAAFVDWITDLGGEAKARTSGTKAGRFPLADLSAFLADEAAIAGIEFQLPKDVELVDGLAVVLVREVQSENGEGKRVKAVEFVTGKRTIEAVASAVSKARESGAKAGLRRLIKDRKWAVLPGEGNSRPPGPGNFHHPDDIKEYLAEEKINAESDRRRSRKRHSQPSQSQLARKGRGKANLDGQLADQETVPARLVEDEAVLVEAIASDAASGPTSPDDDVDWIGILFREMEEREREEAEEQSAGL